MKTAVIILSGAITCSLVGQVTAEHLLDRSSERAVDLTNLHIDQIQDGFAIPSDPKAKSGMALSGFRIKWRNVQIEMNTEMALLAACRARLEDCPSAAALTFIEISEAGRGREGRARIGEINRAINLTIRAVSDVVQHGVQDVWTSPLKTLASGAGDCEDYAITKFAALRELGIADEDLRILIVREHHSTSSHAVVSVDTDDGWLILDNRTLVMVDVSNIVSRIDLVLSADVLAPLPSEPRIARAIRTTTWRSIE